MARIFRVILNKGVLVLVEVYQKGDFKKPDRRKATRPEDRRVHPRYIFFADCDLADRTAGTHYETRVTELAMGGCFVDLPVALAMGTDVHIRVRKEDQIFDADGRAVYNQNAMGNGIAFVSVSPESQKVLESWIQKLAR
jgi:hypothetical protein